MMFCVFMCACLCVQHLDKLKFIDRNSHLMGKSTKECNQTALIWVKIQVGQISREQFMSLFSY